jgi:hypothetical protein
MWSRGSLRACLALGAALCFSMHRPSSCNVGSNALRQSAISRPSACFALASNILSNSSRNYASVPRGSESSWQCERPVGARCQRFLVPAKSRTAARGSPTESRKSLRARNGHARQDQALQLGRWSPYPAIPTMRAAMARKSSLDSLRRAAEKTALLISKMRESSSTRGPRRRRYST